MSKKEVLPELKNAVILWIDHDELLGYYDIRVRTQGATERTYRVSMYCGDPVIEEKKTPLENYGRAIVVNLEGDKDEKEDRES